MPWLPYSRDVARYFLEPKTDVDAIKAELENAVDRNVASLHGTGIDATEVTSFDNDNAFFQFDENTSKWIATSTKTSTSTTPTTSKTTSTTIEIMTFNILVNLFDKFVPGVLETNVRNAAIIDHIVTNAFAIVCLNEVDDATLATFANDSRIQRQYLLSDIAGSNRSYDRNRFGNVVLVSRHIPQLVWRKTHIVQPHVGRRHVLVELSQQRDDDDNNEKTIIISSVHFDARCTVGHFRNRRRQLHHLYRSIRSKSSTQSSSSTSSTTNTTKTIDCDQVKQLFFKKIEYIG